MPRNLMVRVKVKETIILMKHLEANAAHACALKGKGNMCLLAGTRIQR